MAFIATDTKAVVAYNNIVVPANITTVALSGTGVVASTSFPIGNLKYEDPWRMLKVTAAGADPIIDFTFAAAQAVTCFGIINHNLGVGSAYDVQLSYWNGASYSAIGATGGLLDNKNLLLRFVSPGAQSQYRIVMHKVSGWQPFYLGAVFMGIYLPMTTNPIEGAFNQRITVPVLFEESAGDAKHVLLGPVKYGAQAEIAFERISLTMLNSILENIGRRNMRKIIGIIGPESVASVLPTGSEHFFGYLTNLSVAPRQGSVAGQHKADLVLNLEGCI